jgi:CheY-like chemotaxis protein
MVDDDDDDAFLFQEVLHQINPGISFRCVRNGKSALELLRSGDISLPHVIFLDLNMPRMDGHECLSELKKDEQLQSIPVIIYTTSSYQNDVRNTLQNGALSFITKPTNVKDLECILTAVAHNISGDLKGAMVALKQETNLPNVVNAWNENDYIRRSQYSN